MQTTIHIAEIQDGVITQQVFPSMFMTTGDGAASVWDGTTHGCGMATDGVDFMDMDGTILGDGTVGVMQATDMVGVVTLTGVMLELVSDGVDITEIAGAVLTTEVIHTTVAEEDTQVPFGGPH